MKRLLKVISIVNYNFPRDWIIYEFRCKKISSVLTLSIHRAIFELLGESGSAALLDREPLIGKGDNSTGRCLESMAGEVKLPI